MVFFNYSTMQMAAKVVYYGPGLCGKTTNLHYIYQHTVGESRGEMVSLETETDRTLFFDLLPIDVGSIAGFNTRIQLYTVPGQVFYNTTRKLVLKGVDGVVFVADSQRAKLQTNVESFRNLEENLTEMGLAVDTLPLVLQFNKRDLADICSTDEMNAALNRHNWPFFRSLGGDRDGRVRDPQGDLALHPDVAQEAARPQRAGGAPRRRGRRRSRRIPPPAAPATAPAPAAAPAPPNRPAAGVAAASPDLRLASAACRRPQPAPPAAPRTAAAAHAWRPSGRAAEGAAGRQGAQRWTCWAKLEEAPPRRRAAGPATAPPRPAARRRGPAPDGASPCGSPGSRRGDGQRRRHPWHPRHPG